MEKIKCEQVGQIEGTFESTGRVYSSNGLSPTINTCGGGQREPKIMEEPIAYDEQNKYLRTDGTVGTLTTDGSSPKHNNRIIEPMTTSGKTIVSTIRASLHKNGERNIRENFLNGRGYEGVIESNYRIRKLTPKEVFRLMGVKDEDYEKVAKNQSNSSLYHLAGDSIVCNVLMELFNQML